jgi:urea carboxylase-associated protein 2
MTMTLTPQASSGPTTPEEFRQRYLELQRAAREKGARRPALAGSGNPAALPADAIVVEETIPGGWYWSASLARGQSLRIVNDGATGGVSTLFWNQDDPSERYNAGDTVKVQWSAAISKGRVLFSDMGRVLMSVTEDSSAAHDALLGGSTAASNLRKYGHEATRNSRDNFILAVGKHGLGRRDIPPCITFFAPVRTDAAGRFTWQAGVVKQGDFVDLRAEMNVLVALSNCPHPLDPDPLWAPKPIRAIIWRSGEPARDDFCRHRTDEAVRGFDNTDAVFRLGAGGAAR